MAYEMIRLDYDDDGDIATITLNRPDRLNAAPPQMADEVCSALDRALAHKVRAVLITGEGRAFCSGADLAGGGGLTGESKPIGDVAKDSLDGSYNPMIRKLAGLKVPVVIAVNGPAAGVGCSLALTGDFVLASRDAYFLQAFVNIGLVPDGGATWMLPRLVGKARATEMMLLGEKISAEKALDWGMIHSVHDGDALMDEARAIAVRLACGPTKALGLMRRQIWDHFNCDLSDALNAEANAQREAGNSEDAREGMISFLKKRDPEFKGR